ncbi:MAG: hypothetical protein IGNPGNKH_00514 [Sodalis sp. Ffu]|nr:MAG: hypothetical protein IGNPGNKH_00514 [Sodalis sp. Ffu]
MQASIDIQNELVTQQDSHNEQSDLHIKLLLNRRHMQESDICPPTA